MAHPLTGHLRVRREALVPLVALIVALHGLFVIASTLLEQLDIHHGMHISDIDINVPLLLGLGLVYLGSLLRRRKRMAWLVALLVYMFLFGFYASRIGLAIEHHELKQIFDKLILPLLIVALLLINHRRFTVRSDIQSFGYSLRVSVIVLFIAFIYGTLGFMLMDKRDFHQEISLAEAMHRTIDQFGLTSSTQLVPHTRRAHVFIDSLSAISIGAIGYAIISLFQPIRARYTVSHASRQHAAALLERLGGSSEDFFKLWPQDKHYLFSASDDAFLACKVQGGVALAVGDPAGNRRHADELLQRFDDECFGNDWQPVFVHTEPAWNEFYQEHGFSLQKIGEEAIVDVAHFQAKVARNKYFRQIRNRFNREGFTTEILQPPHDKAVLARLRKVSDEWLQRPGRAERGFMMGYYSDDYLQQCPVVVARDSAGTIQGFINRIPSFDADEANFDFLRHASDAPGNINDFLMMAFLAQLEQESVARLNLGLSPLSGIDNLENASLIDKTLRFLYSNGDRFYSFSGLRRFKDKYEPRWDGRYVAYRGTPAVQLVRILNALNSAMKVKKQK